MKKPIVIAVLFVCVLATSAIAQKTTANTATTTTKTTTPTWQYAQLRVHDNIMEWLEEGNYLSSNDMFSFYQQLNKNFDISEGEEVSLHDVIIINFIAKQGWELVHVNNLVVDGLKGEKMVYTFRKQGK